MVIHKKNKIKIKPEPNRNRNSRPQNPDQNGYGTEAKSENPKIRSGTKPYVKAGRALGRIIKS